MSLTGAIPVRFNEQTTARLRAISDKTGLPLSQLVRIATENYLREIENSGSIRIDVLREEPANYRTNKK